MHKTEKKPENHSKKKQNAKQAAEAEEKTRAPSQINKAYQNAQEKARIMLITAMGRAGQLKRYYEEKEKEKKRPGYLEAKRFNEYYERKKGLR